MQDKDREALENEFDLLMLGQGIHIPAERRAGAFSSFLELREMAARLRQPRDASCEPSNVFTVLDVLREFHTDNGETAS